MKKQFFSISFTMFFITCSVAVMANDRKFTYTYESSVLAPGLRELELWNTHRSGKDYFFRRIDQRIEYEFGVVNNLMSAVYMNYQWKMVDSNGGLGGGDGVASYSLSISNEWKWKLADRVADGLGFALYGEATVGLDETELEGKIIIDKQIGGLLLAFNAVAEHEWETELEGGVTATASILKTEFDLGIAYELTPQFSFGMEVRNHNIILENLWQKSALFAGPVLSYTSSSWWATLTILPQLKAFKGATVGGLDLDEHEKVEARLLFSFHL
jgi:hypothetical protein